MNHILNKINIFPISKNSQNIALKKEHALLGISPFNSYYSEERITILINWAKNNFKSFHLFVPNTLPFYNFIALGYSKPKAENKTKKQWKTIKNKIIRALICNGYSEDLFLNKVITTGETLIDNVHFEELVQLYLNKYETDLDFRIKCLSASKKMFEYKECQYIGVEEKKLEETISVQYLLKELPIILNSTKILNLKASVFIYHEKVDFFEQLFNSDNELLSPQQGFLVVQF